MEAAIHVPEVLGQGQPPVEALGPAHAPHHHERAHQALVLGSVLDCILPPRPPGFTKEATWERFQQEAIITVVLSSLCRGFTRFDHALDLRMPYLRILEQLRMLSRASPSAP